MDLLIKKILAYESLPYANWYEVMDPKIIGERVGILSFRIYLFILAQKLNDSVIFASPPQQSDYISLGIIVITSTIKSQNAI